MTLLCVYSKDAVKGHRLILMIEATINADIQKKTMKNATNHEGIFMGLRNYKCLVYKTVTLVEVSQKEIKVSIVHLIFHDRPHTKKHSN